MDPLPPAPTSAPQAPSWAFNGFLRALHPPGSRGKVSLLAKCGGAPFARCFPADEVEPVLPVWTETTSYVGLNRYFGPRGGNRPVAEFTCLYADLDTYRQPGLMALAPEAVTEIILHHIGGLGLPEPSIVIDSGRGLYALWLIEPLPGKAFSRWQAAQRCLVASRASRSRSVLLRCRARAAYSRHSEREIRTGGHGRARRRNPARLQ